MSKLISFSIVGLFEKQFGHRPAEFDFDDAPFNNSVGAKGASLYGVDAFGKTYFMPVTIVYPDPNTGKLVGYDLPYPFISVDRSKTLIRTPLTDRNGSVTELFNTGSYIINIRGFMIGKERQWPESDITTLNNIHSVTDSLTIKSAMTDIFIINSGTEKVVIKRLVFPESKSGDISVRPYEMELESDDIFNLKEVPVRG